MIETDTKYTAKNFVCKVVFVLKPYLESVTFNFNRHTCIVVS